MPQVNADQLDMQPRHLVMLKQLLAMYVPDAEVWAYGSRVNGTGHECSDLDVVLRCPDDLQREVTQWLDLKEALQNSLLPMSIDLHLWSHLPKTFHEEIERRYVVLSLPSPK